MLRITHTRGRMAPRVEHFAVTRLRIGSAPDSEVCFGAGEGIAPLHAEIRLDAGVWQVVDRGAATGTFVNHARVARRPLTSGDVVTLGGTGGPEMRVEIVAEAPAEAPPSSGQVDLPTAQRIVADAVARAAEGDDPTAAIVAAKVAAAQRRATRNNLLLTLGLCVTFAALVATGLAVWDAQRRAGVLTSEAGLDRERGEGKPRGDIPTRVYTGREIYDQNRAAVYLLGWTQGNRVGGVCTAFAIKPNVLATNAHCVSAFKEKGGTPVATQNDSGGKVRYHILAAQVHPGYKGKKGSDAPDVGLVRIDGTMPKITTLANDAELQALGSGDDAYVIGFPGRLMDPISPSATFLQGHIGRLMGLGEREPRSARDAVLVQHDAVTRGGNSGSPIFNQYGHVVAIHAAHLDDEDEVEVGGRKTTVVNASPFRVGMRIDLLRGVPAP